MRRVLCLAIVLLAACTPLACGAGDTATDALSPQEVAAAATKTGKIATYRASFEGTTEAAGQTVHIEGEGEFEAKDKRGHMSLTSSVEGSEFEMEMVMAWPLMYMRFPPELGSRLPPGKRWVRFNMQELGEKLGVDFQQVMQAGQADPAQGLGYLRGITKLEAVGDEQVRGVETTHYRGIVDFRRLADQQPEVRRSIERLIELTKVERVPTEVWVGDDGLVRRMKYVYDMQLPSGQRVSTTMQTELYDFGADVSVEEPPAREVVDLQELMARQS